MRTHHIAAALTAAAALALTSCTGTEVKTTPDKPAASKEAAAKPADNAPKDTPKKQTAAIGDTLTLKGQSDGEEIAVTIKQWVDPAKSKEEFMQPKDGNKYVAAQIELSNTGKAAYNDSPSNGAKVADQAGQQFTAALTMGITAGPELPASTTIAPGDKALGYIVFEVPKASKIAKLHFALNSGFGPQTGQWNIK
ncbi:DUF4352 domain-containing protein [Streptomyces bambusae]|uniref:DUF4352 domain-containing protein n=1 Tax=Streptomyces bambusae TaxID=1550616 RepID=UPI001CFD182E|nr:DUF4352 domain-containing protein [Streptomyces bambusae]MCB5168011.1 DUF4352 domain-containing protein [Streptomyces bambusae]